MKRELVENIIAIELISNEVEDNIKFLSDFSKVRTAVKYESRVINEKFKKEFDLYTSLLQKIVDSYYFSYYEVSSFVDMTLENIHYSIEKNLETLSSMKKLLKFVG